MPKALWVYVDHDRGRIRKVSLELLSKCSELAQASDIELCAVVLGNNVEELASVAANYGAERVFLIDDARLGQYSAETDVAILSQLIERYQPTTLLFGNTVKSRSLAPKLAQRLGVGLASDCVDFSIGTDGSPIFKRPIYAGKLFAQVEGVVRPVLATIRPNSFVAVEQDSDHPFTLERPPVTIPSPDMRVVVGEVLGRISKRPELTEADIVVAGGRGMGGAENFHLLEELADVLGGAAVAASRAAVDSGWREQECQIGQTGKVISPNLYIACGISGSIQHMVGADTSRIIVSINQDPNAVIVNVADYVITGNLFEVIPQMIQEFKNLKAED